VRDSGPHPEDAAALRELARRLATPPDPHEEVSETQVLVGRLPENLPARPPLPEGAAVLGSVERALSHGRRSVEVMLDSPSSAETFRGDYRRQLLAAGWQEADDWPGRGGFNPRGLPLLFRAAYRFPSLRRAMGMERKNFPAPYRLGAKGPKLMVTAQDRSGAPTDVRLHLIFGRRDPWLRHDGAWTAVPTLYPPPNVRGRPAVQDIGVLHPPRGAERLSGGGGGPMEPDGAYSYAVIRTEVGLEELAAHYAAQLQEAGWSRTGGGGSGPQVWNTWTFEHEQDHWSGTFSVLRLGGEGDRYSLQIHATRTKRAGAGPPPETETR
jgi:hypothetical protein